MKSLNFNLKNQKNIWILGGLGLIVVLVVAALMVQSLSVPYDTSDPEVQAKLEQVKEYREQIARDENVVSAYISIGKIYDELGDERRELTAYKQLAKARPLSSPPFVAMGQYYTANGNYAQAEKNMLRAIENDPQKASVYQDLAFLYVYNLHGRDASFEALILDKAQQYPEVKANLIHTLAFYFKEVNNAPKATEYLNQLIELVPAQASEWRQALAEVNS